jgi:hypothetical protein
MEHETPQPQIDMLVSDGKTDFLVHDVADVWVYGVKYPRANRGRVTDGAFELIKMTPETWREVSPEFTEVLPG